MRRILIFSLNYYPRFIGGAEVAVKEITDRIPHTDYEFHMIALRFDTELPKVEKIGNVVVHRIGIAVPHPSIAALRQFPLHLNKHLFQLFAWMKAEELNRHYYYDGIWAMMAHSCAIPAGIFKFFHPRTKYLLTLQEGDPPAHIEALMRPVFPLFRQGFKRADALQTISTFLMKWGRRMGARGMSEVIPNGVDTARFAHTFSADERADAKKRLGKKDGDVYLVTTSRLVHKNAVDDVVRALPLLPAHVSFIVYGIGPDEDALKTLAEKEGVADRVRFMGALSQDAMPRALSTCDIFIRPSRSEGMGNSFVEAMAAGLPVIATQEGGLSDFIFDATRNPDRTATAWAVDKDAPEQIADAVKQILAHPEETAKTVAAAKALALRDYDWGLIATRMKALMDRMFADGKIMK